MPHIHTAEYYLAFKNKEILQSANTRVNAEQTVLSKNTEGQVSTDMMHVGRIPLDDSFAITRLTEQRIESWCSGAEEGQIESLKGVSIKMSNFCECAVHHGVWR